MLLSSRARCPKFTQASIANYLELLCRQAITASITAFWFERLRALVKLHILSILSTLCAIVTGRMAVLAQRVALPLLYVRKTIRGSSYHISNIINKIKLLSNI